MPDYLAQPDENSPFPLGQIPQWQQPQQQPSQAAAPTGLSQPDWKNFNTEQMWTEFTKQKYPGMTKFQPGMQQGSAAGYRGNMGDIVNQYNTTTGGKASVVHDASGDKIDFGDGRGPIDVLTHEGNFWYGGGGGGAAAGGGGGGGGGTGGGGGGGGFGDPRAEQLYNTLMGRANQGLNINPNDQVIRSQVNPFAAAQERERRNVMNQAAEQGGGNANLNLERRMGSEHAGQATAQFQGQLMGRELEARRGEIQQALSGMQGLLTSQQQMALQQKLAELNATIERERLGQQESQFGRQLGYQYDQPFLQSLYT